MTVNDAPTTSASNNPHPPANPIQAFLVFVFRLLLLGVGGGFAWLFGVAIAQFYPAQPQNPPLQEGIMRHTGAVIRDLRRLPRRWSQPPTLDPPPIPVVIPSAAPEASPTPTPNSTATPTPLNSEQRQQLQSELETLQTQLQSLRDRTAELETQLGQTQASADIEARIQTLEQRLSSDDAPTPAAEPPVEASPSPSPPQTIVPIVPTEAEVFAPSSGTGSGQGNDLMVTLPSDVLFAAGQSRLRPETQIILDSIIRDLQSYPGAAIRVAAHTDNSAAPPEVRNLSFQQAEAVQQYMEQALGDRNHWVVIGYGAIRPLVANDTDLNRQRNRRIEIMIEPQ